ncbi:TRAP transporter substrate-binding protein [Geminicoccaceae bacterium 1502E]|nr:TRAP transporter substrate-binding protein [Geminicoccaceae bacterium 1502E]
MRNLVRKAAVAVTVAASLTALPALAQTKWTMASGYPEDSFFTKNIRQLIADVQEATNGELVIDLRPNDELIKHDAIKRAVQAGQVQMGEIRLAVYTNEEKIYSLDNLPNLVTTYDEAWKLMEVQKPYLDELLAKRGMRLITYEPWPGQGFYTAEPVTSLADLEGQSIRIYSPQTQTMCEMMGMKATILPFAEVPQAFSTGLIESLWTSAQTGTDVQAWDYVKHFTYTGSMHNKNAIIVNERAFQALDEASQKALLEAGQRATERGWALSKEASDSKQKELAEHGMVIAEAPEDVMARMREIGVAMVADWREGATDEQLAVLDAYLAAVGR